MSTVTLRPAPPEALGLPGYYRATDTYACPEPVSALVQVARELAARERAGGRRPTVVFQRVRESRFPLLGNPYPRAVLLTALGTDEDRFLPDLAHRLAEPAPPGAPPAPDGGTGPAPPPGAEGPPARQVASLADLPAPQHRPGDGGRYLTAAITVSRAAADSATNLGFYRAQVAGPAELRVFLNPRSDGHRHMRQWHEAGQDMPVAMFMGAHPAHALVAAAERLPTGIDDYARVAGLLGREVACAGDPPAPADAPYLIRGRLTRRLAPEGPFGEFKGLYVPAGEGHVLVVDEVAAAPAPMPFIVPGAESGLALSGLDAELRLYRSLAAGGFPVRSVRYPPEGRGRYLALVESERPDLALLDAVMEVDRTAKLVLCGTRLDRPWQEVAAWPTEVRTYPYQRRGARFGERVGLLVRADPAARRVEY